MGILKFKSVSDQTEKEVSPGASIQEQGDDGEPLVRDWTDEEEAKAKRKLDFIIMPLLTLGFFCLRKLGPSLISTQA